MPENKKEIVSRLQQQILQLQGYDRPVSGGGKPLGLGQSKVLFPMVFFLVRRSMNFAASDRRIPQPAEVLSVVF